MAEAVGLGVVRSYSAGPPRTAGVRLAGGLETVLDAVPVAAQVPGADLTAGRECVLAYVEPYDPASAVLVGVLGATVASGLRVPRGFGVEWPTASENVTMGYFARAVTVKQMNDVVRGTSPSVTWNVCHASARNSGSPNRLWSTNRTTTSQSGAETSSFDDATIPAGSWVWLVTSAKTGTVEELSVDPDIEED